MSSAPFLPCWLTGYDFKPLCDVANMPPETSVDVKAAPWLAPRTGSKWLPNGFQMDPKWIQVADFIMFHNVSTFQGLGCHASDLLVLNSSKDTSSFELWTSFIIGFTDVSTLQ